MIYICIYIHDLYRCIQDLYMYIHDLYRYIHDLYTYIHDLYRYIEVDCLLEAVRTNPGYGMAFLIYNNLLNLILGIVMFFKK